MTVQLGAILDHNVTEEYAPRCLQYSWDRIANDLDAYGASVLPKLLSQDQCRVAIALFTDPTASRIPMLPRQQALGSGNYRYFRYPMPDLIGRLRTALYPHFTGIANTWNERMGSDDRYPDTYAQFLKMCHRAGQILPTSMLLDHAGGQHSFLHQEVYGAVVFPLQVAVLLSQPGQDFTGGEFVITEQRPRMQTRPEVVTLSQGDAVVLAVSDRPVTGKRGTYRVNLRHGFSKVRSGRQYALSIIFHDASA